MLKLPNETLDIIFRSTSRVDLLTLCLVNKRCRDIVERIIYAKIQHIQLFPNTLSNPAHMGCLTVLATSPKPARSLRHFAIQGVPWQSEATFNSITRALLNATCLQSLDLDLGESAEPAFLPESLSASRAVLPFLNAISVTTAEMAGALVPHRPVESVRIAGAATDRSFVQVLPRLAMGTVPVKHFQAAIEGKSHHDIVLAAKGVAYYIPEVVSLCLDFRGLPGKTENHAALIADVARVLGRLPQLAHLALALPTTERGSLSDVLVISRHCTGVSRIELQWNSWSCASGQWKPDPAKQWYALMRRRWAYEHAK